MLYRSDPWGSEIVVYQKIQPDYRGPQTTYYITREGIDDVKQPTTTQIVSMQNEIPVIALGIAGR